VQDPHCGLTKETADETFTTNKPTVQFLCESSGAPFEKGTNPKNRLRTACWDWTKPCGREKHIFFAGIGSFIRNCNFSKFYLTQMQIK
jgi:hypothetical protein